MLRRSSKKEDEASLPGYASVEAGHLKDLEVDIDNIIDAKEDFDIAGDHSPHAEVVSSMSSGTGLTLEISR